MNIQIFRSINFFCRFRTILFATILIGIAAGYKVILQSVWKRIPQKRMVEFDGFSYRAGDFQTFHQKSNKSVVFGRGKLVEERKYADVHDGTLKWPVLVSNSSVPFEDDAYKISPPRDNHIMLALDFGSPGKAGVNGSKAGQPAQVFSCFTDDTHKFAVIHIPKNAGSALANYMNELLCAAAELKPGCSRKVRKGACPNDPAYFIFTFTRNPWARAVSMWSYGLKKLQLLTTDLAKRKQMAYTYCSFEEFVDGLAKKNPRGGCGAHVRDRQYPSVFMRDGRPGVHFAGRLEHFDRDFKTILQRIDPSGKMLKYYQTSGFTMGNDSGHKKYTTYYKDQAMKDAVASFYATDMKLGYTFDTYQEPLQPARYEDGKAAADLSFGDVRVR